MPISDAEFNAWLASDNERRCVLAELDVYSGGASVTRYISDAGFRSEPSDTPANTVYEEILTTVPRFRSVMGELLYGATFISVGEVLIDNSGGVRDSWVVDDIWDGRTVRLLLGDPAWPRSDFRTMALGVAEGVSAYDWSTLKVKMRDRQYLLTKPLQTNFITGTSTQKDMRAPVTYGEVKNIAPVLIDSAARRYKFHDGQVDAITDVRADGVAVAYTADLANGEFTLNAAPTGRITCDVRGSKTGGTYVNSTAQIIKRILIERAGWSASDIDSTDVTTMDTDVPGAVGIYASADSGTLVVDALDKLAAGAGAFFTIDRAGVVRLRQIKLAAGSAVLTITDEDVVPRGVTLARRIAPRAVVRVAYATNWTPQGDSLASSVSAALREQYTQKFQVSKATNTLPEYLMATDEDVDEAYFVNASDASSEATRRATLRSAVRRIYEIRALIGVARVIIGDVVALDLSRYSLAGGVLARVIGVDESLTSTEVQLQVLV